MSWLLAYASPEVSGATVGGEASWGSMAAAASLIAVSCGVLGVYVVLRRMAFVGDALAHTLLPGLVVATALGVHRAFGALVAGLTTAVGIGWLSRRGRLREDTSIGVLFTAMFALGIVLAADRDASAHLEEFLLGALPSVTPSDLWLLAAVAVVVCGAVAVFHKELELASCDPEYAEVIGIRTDRLRYLLLICLALAVVAGVRAVGVLLTAALLITPAAAASLLTRRLPRMIGASIAIAVGTTLLGLTAATLLQVHVGASIVLACTFGFAIAWVLTPARAGERGDLP